MKTLASILALALMLPGAPAQKPSAPKPPPPAAAADTETADPAGAARAAIARGEHAAAIRLLDRAIKDGDADALFLRAQMLETGQGGDANLVQAADLYKRGSLMGHPRSQLAYGRFLLAGLGGLTKDPSKGRSLIKGASDKGIAAAQVLVANWLEDGTGVEKNPAAAAALYQKAAAMKNPDALLGLARLHDAGLGGLEKNPDQATALCREAAELGSVLAINEMGLRYQRGTGLVQDNVAAIGWFNLAAQKGLAEAQVNIGRCYETGNGVLPDLEVAMANYDAAALQGNARAYQFLGSVAERGLSGQEDRVAAYVNYARAAAAGLQEAATKRDAAAKLLSEAERSRAEAELKH
ncbi:MAG: sel1 repeat family protein [Verrucomicrobiales bacterium]|nr:sel1 repeat family protein [Verrucomicrobiales bacterium]